MFSKGRGKNTSANTLKPNRVLIKQTQKVSNSLLAFLPWHGLNQLRGQPAGDNLT